MGARSQPESNENPTTAYETAYEKRDDFSIFVRAVPEAFGDGIFFSLQLQSRPPPKKNKTKQNKHKKLGGGGALYYCPSNIINIL